MKDYLCSIIRTGVPALWAMLLTWLVGKNLLSAELAAEVKGLGETLAALVSAIAVSLYYAVVRFLEERGLPKWLVRLLLGSDKAPAYHDRPKSEQYADRR